MTEKRFESKYDGAFIEDKLNNRTYCCDSQKDWLSICDLLNELSEKPFLKIIDDYYIKYGDDGILFDLHKPSDIRSLIYLINRDNGFSELQCEYNDLEMI